MCVGLTQEKEHGGGSERKVGTGGGSDAVKWKCKGPDTRVG